VIKKKKKKNEKQSYSAKRRVFTSPQNEYCVRETEILVGKPLSKGFFVCDHAGLVINKFSLFS